MSFRLPAAMMKAWTPMTSDSPAARITRNSSWAADAMRSPRWTSTRYRPSTARIPTSPSSSPSAANGKSVWSAGVGGRVDPDVDPRPDVVEDEIQQPGTEHERREAQDDEAEARGRDVQQEQ